MLRSILQRSNQSVRFNLAGLSLVTELRCRQFSLTTEANAATTSKGVVSPEEWRNREEVTLKMPAGVPAIDPIQRFADAPSAITRCKEMCSKFPSPTSVQAQAWPIALAGHDLVSIARTGSGKTLGFLIPVFNHIAKLPRPQTRGYGPAAVILAPTRELAQQIEAEAKSYSNFPLLCAFGGVSKTAQIQKLKQGVDIIIATPGRLNDLLSMDFPATNLKRCSFLVLDEADRMLDMGFEPQLRQILSFMPNNKRQTLMFSATWPKQVQSLAMDFLSNPAQINIGGTALNVCPDVHQTFHLTNSGAQKVKLLQSTLDNLWNKNPAATVILFANTKLGAEQIAEYIREQTNKRVHALHGDKSQEQRDFALKEFRTGRAAMLVCTDVAARGIDVKNVGYVINYDFPSGGVEDWVHRVGRTGRQGAKGEAVTFMSDKDARYFGELETVLNKAGQEVPEWLQFMALKSSKDGFNGNKRYGSVNRNNFGFGSGSRSGFSNKNYGYGSPEFSSSKSDAFHPGAGHRRINTSDNDMSTNRPSRRINASNNDSFEDRSLRRVNTSDYDSFDDRSLRRINDYDSRPLKIINSTRS